jgi:2-enoate reductase
VAALRGHRVCLYEKTGKLGGIVQQAAVPEFKKDLRRLLEWYERQIDIAGVKVEFNTTVTDQLVKTSAPDAVIVATGARPIVPAIPGVDREQVVSAVDMLKGAREPGESAVVVGGGLAGCEVAIWLAQKRCRVCVVEMLDDVMTGGAPVPTQVKLMIGDLMKKHGVAVHVSSEVTAVTSQGVEIRNRNNEKMSLEGDSVVLAIGMVPVNGLADSLDAKMCRTFRIGDCRSPKNVMNAVWDAYEVARTL